MRADRSSIITLKLLSHIKTVTNVLMRHHIFDKIDETPVRIKKSLPIYMLHIIFIFIVLQVNLH